MADLELLTTLLNCPPQLQMKLSLSNAENQDIRKRKNDNNFLSQLEEHLHGNKV